MNIAIVNGSARKGNTAAMVSAFAAGAQEKHQVEIIQADQLKMGFCVGCNACGCYKGCFQQDDTNPTVDKLVVADMIVFATPVYWWGMSAQLKLVIDKCYSKGALLKGKKVGVLVVGGASVDDEQYQLIRSQFECMAKYLAWDLAFFKPFSASGAGELRGNEAVMAELAELGSCV